MADGADPPPVPPQLPATSLWWVDRLRPVFLAALWIGLILFLLWLPADVRALLSSALKLQPGLLLLLCLFGLLALSLVWSAGQRQDIRFFQFFNRRVYPVWLDRAMWLTTQLGNMLSAFLAALIIFLLNYSALAFEIIFGTLTLWLLVETIKALLDRDRPFLTLASTRVIGWREQGDSFPSGHTAQIFFLMTLFIITFHLGIVAAVGMYAAAALVGFTRIYVGVHYPRDVIAGILLGSIWGILTALMTPFWLALRF